jgi:hypothetical protein
MAGLRRLEDVLSISGVQIVHRVHSIAVPGDQGYQWPLVLAAAGATKRTIGVPIRSGAERSGACCISRSNLDSGRLDGSHARTSCATVWTPGRAASAGTVGDQRFAGLYARFL